MRRIKQHTLEKLKYFDKYVNAYPIATKRLRMRKIYIDAFAGTGKCVFCRRKCDSKGGERCNQCGKGINGDGSALLALKTKNEFDGYVLIELKDRNLWELKKELQREIDKERFNKVQFIKGDANEILPRIYDYISERSASLVFLDPEGPELSWKTIVSLSKMEKIDFLMLYAYDMSLVRLTRDYREKLDEFYGTDEWLKIWRSESNSQNRAKALRDFYIRRIKALGFRICNKPIRMNLRTGKRLYHLIFASRHTVAIKIMTDIFNKEPDGQQSMMRVIT